MKAATYALIIVGIIVVVGAAIVINGQLELKRAYRKFLDAVVRAGDRDGDAAPPG